MNPETYQEQFEAAMNDPLIHEFTILLNKFLREKRPDILRMNSEDRVRLLQPVVKEFVRCAKEHPDMDPADAFAEHSIFFE